jgi:NADH-quinone oxidoreductase subunit E
MAYSVENVRCIGCCSLAPVARIDGQVFARLTPKKARSLVRREAPQ